MVIFSASQLQDLLVDVKILSFEAILKECLVLDLPVQFIYHALKIEV
jgi:hypothetical protein